MSTHALIGVATDTGFKAKFVHYDGYPQNMVTAINRIIDQERKVGYTFQDAKNYLLTNHWDGIYPTKQTPADADSHNVVWYDENSDIDHSYLYILDDNEVRCYIPTNDKSWMRLMPEDVIKVKANA